MQKTVAENIYAFAEFELAADRRILLKHGEAVALKSKAFDLLLTLVQNRGEVLSKEELLETVWEGQFVEENNLTVHISALRKIFGEKKGEHRFIATIPGKGYKFVADVQDTGGAIIIENHTISRVIVEEDEIEKPLPATGQLPAKTNFSKIYFIAGSAVLLIVSVAFGYWFWAQKESSAPIESIAVMPFVYEGGNAENEYLSDGMTESLINNLSQLPNLTVKARASVFHYKGKQIEPNKIAGELSVQAILLGRIIERDGNLILSLELVDAKTNNHLWGEQYTRKMSDLATLQTEIARDVSNKLRQKLAKGEALPKGQTANAEAYQLYLRGRFLWNKRMQDEHLKAIALFEQAIALDPNFALAYTGLGDVFTVDSFNLPNNEEKIAKARTAALKALELEPNLADGYAILAKCEWSLFNWAEAEKHFKRAIQLNPNYASARQWYAEFLTRLGKTEESFAEIKRALELDPLSLIINSNAAYIFMIARQYDRAVAQCDKTLELDATWRSAYLWRAITNEYKGNFLAALADYEKLSKLSKKPEAEQKKIRDEISEIRQALEKSGANGYWRKVLEIEKRRPATEVDFNYLAILYANIGDKENALDSLEKAVEKKQSDVDFMKVEPHFDTLRAEPRFQALVRRIGLEP